MKSDIQRRFIKEIEKRFGFLKPTFRGLFLWLGAKAGILYVYFVGSNLAVEFILDERDEDIACKNWFERSYGNCCEHVASGKKC